MTDQYNDEAKDRKTLETLYSNSGNLRKTAREFKRLRSVDLYPIQVRWLLDGWSPGKKLRKRLNWPPLAEILACPECGEGHPAGFCTKKYDVKAVRKNGHRKPRKRVTVDLPVDINPVALEAIRSLSKEERADILASAARMMEEFKL
jgi:hypothetical protein